MLTQEANAQNATSTLRIDTTKAMGIEWIGQTVASLCWITSVFVYGIAAPGDWLQLFAASAWFVANVAAVTSIRSGHVTDGSRDE
ncbi:MAG: hypothetical protein AAFP90_17160 [Planctomycetota bacterium]